MSKKKVELRNALRIYRHLASAFGGDGIPVVYFYSRRVLVLGTLSAIGQAIYLIGLSIELHSF